MSETYRLQQRRNVTQPPAEAGTPTASKAATAPAKRLVSLDAYRGFIMSMLAASGFGILQFSRIDRNNEIWNTWNYDRFQWLKFHFDHPAWVSISGWFGVSFWDLIQPAFMFMVGVAMPFSFQRREAMGSSSWKMHAHAIVRSIVLVLMGVFLYSMRQSQTNWIFTNVLAQIGLGYFFAYLCLGRSRQLQIGVFVGILVGYWGLFVMNRPPENFDYETVDASFEKGEVFSGRMAAWSKNANVAHFFDVWLLNRLRMPVAPPEPADAGPADSAVPADPGPADPGPADPAVPAEGKNANESDESDQTVDPATSVVAATPEPSFIRKWWFSAPERYTHNSGGYLTLNFVPSIATTLLGIMCGQLLLGPQTDRSKVLNLVLIGVVCLLSGVAAHHFVCPIVKRIWTPSWVLFSGGYVVLMLALFYTLFDVLPFRKLAFPLVVVGMNSIAMYMFGQLLRPWVTEKIVTIHFGGMLDSIFGPNALASDGIGAMVAPTATFIVFWLTAFWMYRKRYFIRV